MNKYLPDGEYMLNQNHGFIRVYCHHMAGTPKAYITLRYPNRNYGLYYNLGARTTFIRVAVDTRVRHLKASECMRVSYVITNWKKEDEEFTYLGSLV